jgi:glutamate racemase
MVGVLEPGAKDAVATGARRIGVLATLGTVTSGAYSRAITRLRPEYPNERRAFSCIEIPCPRFVPLVEAGETRTPEARRASMEYLEPMARERAEAIILGCTHYPFLLPTLRNVAEEIFPETKRPVFVNPAYATSREAGVVLASRGMAATPGNEPRHHFCVSGDREHFLRMGSLFLESPITDAEQIHLD